MECRFFSKVQPEIAVESSAEASRNRLQVGHRKWRIFIVHYEPEKRGQKFQRIDIKFIGFDADELVVVQLKEGRYLLATSNEYLRKLINFGSRDKIYLMLSDTFRTVSECTDRQGFGDYGGLSLQYKIYGYGLVEFPNFWAAEIHP